MNSIMRRTLALALLTCGALVVGCTPPSGLPDARQYDLGTCGQFEVRLGGQVDGVAFVAVRRYGFQLFADSTSGACRIFSLELGTGPDAAHITLHGCARSYGVEGCDSYSAGFVGGGVWDQLASNDGLLQSARIGLSDLPEEIATRYLVVYP